MDKTLKPGEIIGTVKGLNTKCPRCGKNSCFSLNNIKVPLNLKVFFIKFQITVSASFEYCPKCGHLKISLK